MSRRVPDGTASLQAEIQERDRKDRENRSRQGQRTDLVDNEEPDVNDARYRVRVDAVPTVYASNGMPLSLVLRAVDNPVDAPID
jgi:hypothetical protein